MSDVQIAVIDQQDTQIVLAVPGVQGATGSSIPSGGTTDQVLRKNSSTNYDAGWTQVTSAMIADGAIVNADVNNSAAIAGTKISPDFGGQAVTTTGQVNAARVNVTANTAPTNGLYLPSANTVAISTSGSQRLAVDASGNVNVDSSTFYVDAVNNRVAVGISNPLQLLHLSSASAPITQITYQSVGAAQTGVVAGGAYTIGVDGGNGSTERFRITQAGLVGVGTSSPGVKIDIVSDNNTSLASVLRVNSNNVAVNTSLAYDGLIGSGELFVRTSSASKLYLGTNNTNALTIDSSQRVGVGTTSPVALLQPNGTVSITGGSGASSANGLHLYFDTATNSGTITAFHSGVDNRNLTLDGKTIGFTIAGTERARIDSSGRLLVGTSTARTNLYNLTTVGSRVQVEVASGGEVEFLGIRNLNNTEGGQIVLAKSRGTTVGSNTVVQANDELGVVSFQGSDGAEFVHGASIKAEVDGTPGTNDMPGRLVFSTTADGASSPTERMRIGQNGYIKASNSGSYAVTSIAAGTEAYHQIISNAANINLLTSATNSGGTAHASSVTSTSATGDLYRGYVEASGGIVYRVFANGDVQNTNGSYTTLSDAKLKENIVDAGSQWDDLKAIQIRNWNFKTETGHETHRQIGPIAQELETVCPGLVFDTPDRDKDGNETGEVTKGVNQSVLYMKAVKALQEAMERIEQLETEMAAVRAQLS